MDDAKAHNLAHWDEVTALHLKHPFYETDRFRAGESILDPIARDALGDVRGKRFFHMQCHFGLDTLSIARLGAEVTGVDFSGAAIAAARALSAETGVPGTFIHSDILAAPVDAGAFDIAFASWGAICWIADLRPWMQVAARALKPGGRLILIEGHPAMLMLGGEAGAPFTVMSPYASETPAVIKGVGDYADREATVAADVTVEWSHGIGTILTAALEAGLAITAFEELDRVPWFAQQQMVPAEPGYWKLPDGSPSFPLAFKLVATKPG